MNTFRTTILLAVLTVLLIWIGDMLGGRQGAIIALLLAGGMNFFSYWFSDKIVLKMYGGQEVSAQDDPELYGIGSGFGAEGRTANAQSLRSAAGYTQRLRDRA